MRSAKMLLHALGVEGAVLEDVRWEETSKAPRLVVSVRPVRDERKRCSLCGRRCRGYDRGEGLRTWRAPALKALEVARGEHETRLEPELKKFLGGFTGRALESVKAGVGAGSRDLAVVIAGVVLGFVLDRPVKDLAAEVERDRLAHGVKLAAAILGDLDDDEPFRARRRELVEGFVRRHATRPVREVLADHGIAVEPQVPSLAHATFPLVLGVAGLAPVRAWCTQFAERVARE